ncbi:MAG: hypothetical protein VW236_04235 [Flavobacteriaceae bacterium]
MTVLAFFLLLLNPPSINERDAILFPAKTGFNIISNDSIYYTEDGVSWMKRKHNYDVNIYRLKYVPELKVNSVKYLISAGGGEVYKYDETLDTLYRVDNSYRFLSRFGEAIINVSDTIFSFGGYGEFQYNNKLIAFKKEYREWTLLPTRNNIIEPRINAIIQYDSIDNSIYIGAGESANHEFEMDERTVYKNYFKISLREKVEKEAGNLMPLSYALQGMGISREDFKLFDQYRIPLFYSDNEAIAIDMIKNKAFKFIEADLVRLENFTNIVAYNKRSHNFLLGIDLTTRKPRLNIVSENDLLGLEYIEYDLSLSEGLPGWAYGLIGVSLLLFIPLFRTRTFVGLDQAILKEERKIKQQLSSEDFVILKRIVEAFPENVEYPELQNSYEKDLSYESRIKKLRASIKEIDEVVQKAIGRKRSSIFEIDKGREDKRIKVIRIKDESLKKTDFFGRLRRGSK